MRLFAHFIFPALILSPQYAVGAGDDGGRACTASSAEARIGAPVAGYVFDPAVRSIRPVLGTPGASVVGDPLDIALATGGLSVSLAVVSPKQDFAVIVGAEDSLVRVLGLQDGACNSRLLAPAATGPKQILFSPGGGTAGLYQPGLYQQDSARLQIFTHLPENPVLAHEISLAGWAGDLHAAAISDDGELALLSSVNNSDPELSSTWLSLAGADPVRLEVPPSISVMSFQGASHDAAMAARDGQIYILRNVETNPYFRVLSPSDERTSEPVAIRFSADGTRVYVATRQGTVASFGIQTGSASFISCRCTPSVLVPFHSPMLFRLNEFSDGPLMLLDTTADTTAATTSPELQVWFVPAVVPAAGTERVAQ